VDIIFVRPVATTLMILQSVIQSIFLNILNRQSVDLILTELHFKTLRPLVKIILMAPGLSYLYLLDYDDSRKLKYF